MMLMDEINRKVQCLVELAEHLQKLREEARLLHGKDLECNISHQSFLEECIRIVKNAD